MANSKDNLVIKDLHVSLDGQMILRGVSTTIPLGKVTALMGPNGSGKSTLANVLAGKPGYTVKAGSVTWQGKNLLKLEPWQRARLGLFLAWQYPTEVPGVNLREFLRTIYQIRYGTQATLFGFHATIIQALKNLKLPENFLERSLNEGFSGGEKKKSEILQLMVLKPKIAVLDETDSGLDIDALRLIASNINKMRSDQAGFLVITHYQRLLNHLKPDKILIMAEGKIAAEGGPALAKKLEKQGYQWLAKQKTKT
ncbi:MAG: Fe-S cluster assembly ATPase SufC [Candidatus Buchananbacteria bacterium RIFCSPLOWO2_01_FULL_46_12]|uniref:Fe-S cluster assembly ATPase SufC n=1 Tax=Candidatus Buchananbacteria bacterium RIFCSPLOWO2_01_FULL_46_12 TaxID=1797546 RepID=A0A1G1YTZ0_9BACT|nr:MAG: Fe-S cluster assembly ATPase SufC [Candidatus Buchananbacteria bacterium RIFCSPLOWO2_01_FULL_46_12]